MAALPYSQWLPTLAAYWLAKGKGSFYLSALGGTQDGLESRLRIAVKSRFPDFADPRALSVIGADRVLEQYPGSTSEFFASKLKEAFDVWYWGGTPHGLLRELVDAFDSITSDVRSWLIITPIGRWIHFDVTGQVAVFSDMGVPFSTGLTGFWNTFTVVGIVETSGTAPADGSTSADLGRRVIQKWRPGHARNTLIRLITDDSKLWGGCDWTFDFTGATPMPEANLLHWGDVGLTWGADGTQVDWTPPSPQ